MRGLLIASFLLTLPVTQVRGQSRRNLPAGQVKYIEEQVSRLMTEHGIPGLSLAVAVDNRLRYAKGFGFGDLENSVHAQAETVYRTASIAKAMTAVGVLRLVERGQLDLDAPIQEYCDGYPRKKWPLTARQLLGHLGGIRHYKSPAEAVGTRHFESIQDSLVLFKGDPLLHQPGSKFRYTTYGYTLLGCALEKVSSQSYGEFMHKEVFRPAGMRRTRLDDVYAIIPRRARGYRKLSASAQQALSSSADRGRIVSNAQLHDTSMKVPGGGLVSSSVDLVRFAISLNTGKLLKQSTRQEMWTRQKTSDGKLTQYGLGWRIDSFRKLKRVGHSGGQAGTSTHLVILPERGIVVAGMSNLQGVRLRTLTSVIAAHLAGIEGIAWHDLISPKTIENEVRRRVTSLADHTKTPAAFKAGYRQARRDMSIMAVMFGAAAEHQSSHPWRSSAAMFRDHLARSARVAKTNSAQAGEDARKRVHDLQRLLKKSDLVDSLANRSQFVEDWSSVIDRSPLMQRLNEGAKRLRTVLAKKTAFAAGGKTLRHETEIVQSLARVIAAKGMEDAMDDDYRRAAAKLSQASAELNAAGRRGDYTRSRMAFQGLTQACAACHESFRLP